MIDDNFICPLEIETDTSCGLQLVDVLLWLCKRHIENPNQLQGNCKKLMRYLTPQTYITELSYNAINKEVTKMKQQVMNMSFTQKDMRVANETLTELETIRKERMLS